MANIQIQVPKDLGLSDDQVNQLRSRFVSQLVDSLRAEKGEAVAAAAKAKAEVVHVEVIAL